MTPLVSVIIPAYNSEAYLGQTIESVLGQTLGDLELVVLDDGSRDGTFAIAEGYAQRDPRVRALRQENAGIAAARNRALAETTGAAPYVIFLDNDDLWEPDTLETLAKALEANPACAGAHGLARSIDPRGVQPEWDDLEKQLADRRGVSDGRVVSWPVDQPTSFAVLAVHNSIVSPGVTLVRREAIAQSGGFVAETVPCDDWDIWLRITRRADIAYVPRVLLSWRRHESNASDRSGRWRAAYYLVRRRMITAPENTPEQRRIARLAHLHLCRRMAADAARHSLRRPANAVRDLRKAGYGYSRYLQTMFAR